jgi:hypothetical protein
MLPDLAKQGRWECHLANRASHELPAKAVNIKKEPALAAIALTRRNLSQIAQSLKRKGSRLIRLP